MEEMTPNIYLDIDGVLLVNDRVPTLHVREFLVLVLERFPDTTYWLTTHCMDGDADEPFRNVGRFFDSDTLEIMRKIKPTAWKVLKTEAIDFSKPFLWFDDDLYDGERVTLIEHNALDNWIRVDLAKNPDQLNRFIQSFPLPVEKTN